jgi:CRP-like cAMP-binding protein
MPTITLGSTTNRLLAGLPRDEYERFVQRCDEVELNFEEILTNPGDKIDHVYFPTDSFISLITPSNDSRSLEVGIVGDEGMLGISLILEVDVSPVKALVQGAGPSLRMDAGLFLHELKYCPELHKALKRYLYVMLQQLTQTTVCTRFHLVEARLARWILMTQDRAHSNKFQMTHKFFADMLGVRRSGITKAATSLQNRKLIHYSRGNVTVLDRAGLKKSSCQCYKTDNLIYRKIMG